MSMTQAAAEQKAREYEDFNDHLWASSTNWSKELLQQTFADDLQLGWQGKWTNGFDACYAQWIPLKEGGLMKKRTSMGLDVVTWGESMVSWKGYAVLTTFEDKELFIPIQMEANWNDQGKINRISFIMSKKYEAEWNGLVGSFLSAQ